MEFQISSKKETCKEILESSKLKFLEIFSAIIFVYQMQKTTPLGC